jgi:predicted alpha-1,2-mannosidase
MLFVRSIAALTVLCLMCGNYFQAEAGPDLASLVNPFIGTDNWGYTYPGATAPFGMVQLSPLWDRNGYNYPESKMHGFVVNLMSGCDANEGQVLMTATTGPVKVDRSDTDYTFDHQHESASAGYYQVKMQPWGIDAQLTALTHSGCAKFTFPAGAQKNIILPISYASRQVSVSNVHVLNSSTITGDVTSDVFYGSAQVTVYFVMQFSRPFDHFGTWNGTKLKEGSTDASQPTSSSPVIGFYGSYAASPAPDSIRVRIGISYVDNEGAINNLKSEMPGNGSFEQYLTRSKALWNTELNIIDVEGSTPVHKTIFYTSLYHSLLAPQVADDADGRYFGYDQKIHTVDSGHQHYYETYSGWDIYRSEIPLLSIIEPTRTQDIAQSIVDMSEQLGYIDRWPALNQPISVMNGNPLTVCLVNIWNSGLHNFDIDTVYKAMWKQSQYGDPHNHLAIAQWVTEEKQGITLDADAPVSDALEYDESFAALGHLAEALGKEEDANFLFARALQYRTMFNPATGYLQRQTENGQWDGKFSGYTEGNRWIYLWFVPEDVQGLVDLMGGAPAFDSKLDQFFGENRYDPTNEPDLQAPFLYDYINRPWKTQKIVAETADQGFTDTPGGLAGGGNDDLGTMSAWYVLSQLGFYFVDPGVNYAEVATPRFPKAILHIGSRNGSNGSIFEIDAPNAGGSNEYIQSATLNGVPLNKPWFPESAITRGGNWSVTVGTHPNQSWGSSAFDRPYSLSTGFSHVPKNPILSPVIPDGGEAKYTTNPPADGWFNVNFDDSAWQTGARQFGNAAAEGSMKVPWGSGDIWLRRTFTLSPGFAIPQLIFYEGQIGDVYINGNLAISSPADYDNWRGNNYNRISLPDAVVSSLHVGQNLLAVHVANEAVSPNFAYAGLVDLSWPEDEK